VKISDGSASDARKKRKKMFFLPAPSFKKGKSRRERNTGRFKERERVKKLNG